MISGGEEPGVHSGFYWSRVLIYELANVTMAGREDFVVKPFGTTMLFTVRVVKCDGKELVDV